MKDVFLLIVLLGPSYPGWAKKNIKYLNTYYGSVHQSANASSTSLTVLECGHPLKVLQKQSSMWSKVKAGMHIGYIKSQVLQSRRPKCFQDRYSRYFESLNLTVTDYYFWARLYDNYIMNTSRPEGE